MKFGKEIPMWEAVKTLQEGGKVGVAGVLRKYILEGREGKFFSEGTEISTLPIGVRYHELTKSTGFAKPDDEEHYYIKVNGEVTHHNCPATKEDIEYGNAFSNKEFAIWMASWTKLMYNMRRFANEHNTIEYRGHYYWLVYNKATEEVDVTWGKSCLPAGAVLFHTEVTAKMALDKFGQEYKALIDSAPEYIVVK